MELKFQTILVIFSRKSEAFFRFTKQCIHFVMNDK
jgi:hypothetical protein